ncbi:MAG: HPF/RaiA family ribosome-associated protein [Deltaproteobacteria bacterium]|jgi:ribosome-associated translation inhibitor RaiA
MKIVFKNLERSELAKELVQERLEASFQRFPDLKTQNVAITLDMENSPQQSGPDVFSVKLHVSGGRYQGITLEKKAPNLYQALADVNEHLLERLNRFGDKTRNKLRRMERRFAS